MRSSLGMVWQRLSGCSLIKSVLASNTLSPPARNCWQTLKVLMYTLCQANKEKAMSLAALNATRHLTADSCFKFSFFSLLISLQHWKPKKVLTGHYCIQITLKFHHLPQIKLVVCSFLCPSATSQWIYDLLLYGPFQLSFVLRRRTAARESLFVLWKMCEDVMGRLPGSQTAACSVK